MEELGSHEERTGWGSWANDRTSCDKMMGTKRHVSFVYEPNTGSDREKFARFDSVGRS